MLYRGVYFIIFPSVVVYRRESLHLPPVTALMLRETVNETLYNIGLSICNSNLLLWGFMKSDYPSIGLTLQYCSDRRSFHFMPCIYCITALAHFYCAFFHTLLKWQYCTLCLWTWLCFLCGCMLATSSEHTVHSYAASETVKMWYEKAQASLKKMDSH